MARKRRRRSVQFIAFLSLGYFGSVSFTTREVAAIALIALNGESWGSRSGLLCVQPIPDAAVGSISYMTLTSPGWRKG